MHWEEIRKLSEIFHFKPLQSHLIAYRRQNNEFSSSVCWNWNVRLAVWSLCFCRKLNTIKPRLTCPVCWTSTTGLRQNNQQRVRSDCAGWYWSSLLIFRLSIFLVVSDLIGLCRCANWCQSSVSVSAESSWSLFLSCVRLTDLIIEK